MYGSLGKMKSKYEVRVPLRNIKERPQFFDDLQPSKENYPDFWEKVEKSYIKANSSGQPDVSYSQCLNECLAENIRTKHDKYDDGGKDPVVLMMTDWYDEFKEYEDRKELVPVFEKQMSKLSEILIGREFARANKAAAAAAARNDDDDEEGDDDDDDDEDEDCRYSEQVYKDANGVKKSLLHLAAERNFVDIAECLLQHNPKLVYLPTHGGGPKKLPIECALENFQDDVGAFIIKSMSNKRRVRELFEYNEDANEMPKYKFKDYIKREDMQKTVIAVLDCLINPDWPYMPVKDQKDAEKQWHKMPDVPIRYHFYYRILDGDSDGRPAKIPPKDDNDINAQENPGFNHRAKSCLQSLCESKHNKMAIRHPVVRQLGRRKWDDYGRFRVRLYAYIYIIYLVLLTIALLGAIHSTDPRKYKDTFDFIRVGCEVLTLAMVIFYLCSEFDQMEKERTDYWWDPFNWFDLIGLLGILLLIPLRFWDSNYQWHVAAIAYLVNFLRIFKFFPAWMEIGVYSKTLAGLMKKDLKLFSVVYVVVFFAFSGCTYLSLRATTTYNSATGFDALKINGFKDILLRQVRALAEGNPFNDSYDGFSPFVVIIIILNMLVVMVVLVNILIAQLSSTYESAKANAVLQYDIDRTIFVTRIENSRLRCMNKRIEHYKDGDFVNEKELVNELLSDWDVLHPDEGKDAQLSEFRKIMKAVDAIEK